MNVPFNYNYINANTSTTSPSTYHAHNTELAYFFRKYLLQKAISVFKWEMPKYWEKDYFLYCLYELGFLSVLETDKYGVIPQFCSLSGYDVFYRPTTATISNPLLGGINQLRIGKQCTLFKLQANYSGIMDIVNYYADLMAMCAKTAGVNLANSMLSYVFFAKNKQSAESFKKMFDQLQSGNLMAVVDKSLFDDDGGKLWDSFSQDVGKNYIVSDILADLRKIETMFDTDIGIPNANTDKKERLIVDEVNANNTETESKCALWLENLQQACLETKEMFGIDISVDWRFKPKGAMNGVSVNTGNV